MDCHSSLGSAIEDDGAGEVSALELGWGDFCDSYSSCWLCKVSSELLDKHQFSTLNSAPKAIYIV